MDKGVESKQKVSVTFKCFWLILKLEMTKSMQLCCTPKTVRFMMIHDKQDGAADGCLGVLVRVVLSCFVC